MSISPYHCRNCNSHAVKVLRKGYLAPFFAKRVLNIDISSFRDYAGESYVGFLNTKIAHTPDENFILNFKSFLLTQIRYCETCDFIGPHTNYTKDQLDGLYHDYRAESYNNERSYFEPFYADVKDLVGNNPAEIKNRNATLDEILQSNIDTNKINYVLDFGGSEGRFVPPSLQNKNVTILDVSSAKLVNPNYRRVEKLKPSDKFDYIQICHVLEHVSSPREIISSVLPHLNKGAIIYLEVPLDKSDEELNEVVNGGAYFQIHEHINLYNKKSIKALGEKLNFKCTYNEIKIIDVEWTKANVICTLFQL